MTTGTITKAKTNAKGVTHTTTKKVDGLLNSQPIYAGIMREIEQKMNGTKGKINRLDIKPIFDEVMRGLQYDYDRDWDPNFDATRYPHWDPNLVTRIAHARRL